MAEQPGTFQHINRTLVGRDDDGRIWIKLLEEGRPSPTALLWSQVPQPDPHGQDAGARW